MVDMDILNSVGVFDDDSGEVKGDSNGDKEDHDFK